MGGTHVKAPGGGGALLLLAARFSPSIICSICSIICASGGIDIAGLGRNVRAPPAPPHPRGMLPLLSAGLGAPRGGTGDTGVSWACSLCQDKCCFLFFWG